MADQKNPARPPQKQDKSGVREPQRKPDEGGESERDRSSNRDDAKGDADSSVISNDDEVEVRIGDLEEDDESNQPTGRHPSLRDRDLK